MKKTADSMELKKDTTDPTEEINKTTDSTESFTPPQTNWNKFLTDASTNRNWKSSPQFYDTGLIKGKKSNQKSGIYLSS